jgi:hypothetical protein
MNPYEILQRTERQRVSDGAIAPVLDLGSDAKQLVLVWSQLGDFDSLEYAWWLQKEKALLKRSEVRVRAIGIGNRASGQKFCQYTGFPEQDLFVDPTAEIHHQLSLYSGLTYKWPGLLPEQRAWLNLMLMCAGIGSPGTLAEVLRGYLGDRRAPQLIDNEEVVKAGPLPPLNGKSFALFGQGFQRPIELATLRLRNMTEVLSNWQTYVPDAAYLTQRGATYLFDPQGTLLYSHRDPGILGFAANRSCPLDFLLEITQPTWQ